MKKGQIIIKCAGCPIEFQTTLEQVARGRKFHSMECHYAYMRANSTTMSIRCLRCGVSKYEAGKGRILCENYHTKKHKFI